MPPRLIEVDYEVLPSAATTEAAIHPDAPVLWDDCPGNEAFFFTLGNKGAVDAAFARADHVTKVSYTVNRISRQFDGAAGDHRRLRPAHRALYALHLGAEHPSDPRQHRRHHEDSGKRPAHRHRRCRRRLRHEGRHLPGPGAGAVGVATAEPAGALDRRAHRVADVGFARRATTSPPPSWRSTGTANSSASGSAPRPGSAPIWAR